MAAIAAAPLFALPALGTATAASPEVFDALRPGARVLTLSWGFPISLIARRTDDDLRGEVCEERRTCKPVSYPWLDRGLGVALVDYTLHSEGSPGQQIVFGYSQGARVASGWLKKHAGTADAPTPDELSLVLIGNPGRKYGGGHVEWGQPTPATDYSVLDVSRQYDLGSDVPDDRFNLLAMANALAGFGSVHMDYADVDIYDPANYVWTEGNTTYVFVPAKRLPILDPLYVLGLTELADALDAPLRAIIEEGYDRSYLPAQPGLPPAEADPEPESPSAEPAQAVAAAVAAPGSRSTIAQDQNDAANLLADSTDSSVESESGSVVAEVVDGGVVNVDVDVELDAELDAELD
ncbi:MAG: PE-PPE domain-containing protein, partial [Mycobacterium sp.]